MNACSTWQHWRSYQRWMIFKTSPFSNWDHFWVNACSMWQPWKSHQRWIVFIMDPFSNWVHFRVNACSTWQHWRSHHKWIIITRSPFIHWVYFGVNTGSTWQDCRSHRYVIESSPRELTCESDAWELCTSTLSECDSSLKGCLTHANFVCVKIAHIKNGSMRICVIIIIQ